MSLAGEPPPHPALERLAGLEPAICEFVIHCLESYLATSAFKLAHAQRIELRQQILEIRSPALEHWRTGGNGETRTHNPLLAKQALSL